MSDWTLHLGDCLDPVTGLASLADGSVDCILTDPPYNVSEEGADIVHAGTDDVAHVRDFGEWDRSGWSPSKMLAEAGRILPQGGSLLSFTSDRLLSSFRESSILVPRGTVVWEKTNAPPTPRPQYVSAAEWIVWLVRPGMRAVWNGGGYTPNILRYPICGGVERTPHPTQKPLALLRDLIRRHTNHNDLICDPFSGSGTTGVAALSTGRRFVGWERDPKYHAIAIKRLSSAREQLELCQ